MTKEVHIRLEVAPCNTPSLVLTPLDDHLDHLQPQTAIFCCCFFGWSQDMGVVYEVLLWLCDDCDPLVVPPHPILRFLKLHLLDHVQVDVMVLFI